MLGASQDQLRNSGATGRETGVRVGATLVNSDTRDTLTD